MKKILQSIAKLMTSNPITIRPNTSLFEAYDQMTENDIRRLPVVGSDDTLIGIITLSDVQKAIPQQGSTGDREAELLLNRRHVSQVMTTDPLCVSPEDTIQDVAEIMLENQISGVPVIQGGKVIGIITESDIFRMIVETWGDLEQSLNGRR